MFSERDASKVKFFCETLVSAYSREFSNFFLTSSSPSSVPSSLGSRPGSAYRRINTVILEHIQMFFPSNEEHFALIFTKL